MTLREVVRLVVGQIEAARGDYLLVGAVAYFVHGVPRVTKDVVFVIAMPPELLDRTLRELPEGFRIDPQARMELFTGTMRWVVEVAGAVRPSRFRGRGDPTFNCTLECPPCPAQGLFEESRRNPADEPGGKPALV